jgi:Ca-activated chloride channel family protein
MRGDYAEAEWKKKGGGGRGGKSARAKKHTYDRARELLRKRDKDGVTTGKLGVDFALNLSELRSQARLERSAVKRVYGRTCLEVGGVWIDQGFKAKTKAVTVKAQSDAYFRILERHPKVKAVFGLGNHLVWLTPSGIALVIDTSAGKEKMADKEIDKLFVAAKK